MEKTVLLVDTDQSFVARAREACTQAGFRVLTADSAAGAQAVLDNGGFDLAVTEIMLEHQDSGFTLCYRIKRHDPTIPVIICTSIANTTDLEFDASTDEERSWVKADVMLKRPVRFEQLISEIEQLLQTNGRDRSRNSATGTGAAR